ncbi:MAG: DNA/RNA nuclease SfsA [Deltaproteobacteria bacterium]|nr:MAG: DNA/RNA nuclease SfsA [Deltaproteobacteria bacterium]TNF27719.1 MAG: DNA/RNA nuclease SfsA [Deltaproteobacteria bacterium]
MQFQDPLVEGTILKRYKRFLADVELPNGEIITAHTANTGSMKTCWEPGWKVLMSFHDNPKRKLKYSLEMIHNSTTWIGINTSLPNKMAVEAIENGTIKELQGYAKIKPEAKIGNSRIDILLTRENAEQCYVEVKNVTLLGEKKKALFPDAVSERGQKHLKELTGLVKDGIRSAMLYIVQREDVTSFSPADDIDPEYGRLLREAKKAGVEILCYQCKLTPKGIEVIKPLPVEL